MPLPAFQTNPKKVPRARELAAMATEKQIAANRANAKRSTGPKTAALLGFAGIGFMTYRRRKSAAIAA